MRLGVIAGRNLHQRGRSQHVFLVVQHVGLPLHPFDPPRHAAKHLLDSDRLVVPCLPFLFQEILQLLLLLVAEFKLEVLVDNLELFRTEAAGVFELEVAGSAGAAGHPCGDERERLL